MNFLKFKKPFLKDNLLNLRRSLNMEMLENRCMLSIVPLAETFSLHSLPEATHSIYLDFDGHTTSGTNWNSLENGGNDIITPAFDTDGDVTSFSDAELELIQRIWAYTAEYFASFNVDVTTEEPSPDELKKSGSSDTAWGIRVVIGGSCTDWYTTPGAASGVAYINSFRWDTDTPCFIFEESRFSDPVSVSGTIVHEVGHSLGLTHDSYREGDEYIEYYAGSNGWSPIMGGGSGPVFQWSKGEYDGATNQQDDLAIITSVENGFGYRSDDFGNTKEAAQNITVNSSNDFNVSGIIEQNTDADYFTFTISSSDNLYAYLSPSEYNFSLDTQLELQDEFGTVLATSAPTDSLDATIIQYDLAPGTYYLAVKNDGCGDYYSAYGSIGSYVLSGTIGNSLLTTVTTTADISDDSDGVISLREAIENASVGSRVTFSSSVFSTGSEITLTEELAFTKSITIDASSFYDYQNNTPGITITTTSGRIFNLTDEANISSSASHQVTLIGLGLTGGSLTGVYEIFSSDPNYSESEEDKYTVSNSGGAILAAGTLRVQDCAIYNNSCTYYGGAIGSLSPVTNIYLINTQVYGNTGLHGGAISITERMSTIQLDGCIIAGNQAARVYSSKYYSGSGGALYANYSCSTIEINNSVIMGNKSAYYAVSNFGVIHVQNSTIAGNVAISYSAGVNFGAGTQKAHTIVNSIIAQNTTRDPSEYGDVVVPSTSTVTSSYSLIGVDAKNGVTSSTGNILGSESSPADPGFLSFTPPTYSSWNKDAWRDWDLSLSSDSSALDAGSNSMAYEIFNVNSDSELAAKTDVTGTSPRLSGTAVDMGAYEYLVISDEFDLTASNFGTIPSELTYGDVFSLTTGLISNTGNISSGAFIVQFFAATDPDFLFSASAISLGSQEMESLAAGSSKTVTLTNIDSTKLTAGTSYYFGWKIVSSNDSDQTNNTGSHSSACSVQRIPLTSVSLSPDAPVIGSPITSTLTPADATVTYQWYRSTSPSGNFTLISSSSFASYTPTLDDLGYYIRCTVTGTENYTGVVSETTDSTVSQNSLSRPILNVPTVEGRTVSVSWTQVAGATEYEFQYKIYGQDNWNSMTVTENSASFQGQDDTTYEVRVKAKGENLSESVFSFSTAVSIQATLKGVSLQTVLNDYSTANSMNTIPASETTITDWDEICIELWTEGVSENTKNDSRMFSITYDPTLFVFSKISLPSNDISTFSWPIKHETGLQTLNILFMPGQDGYTANGQNTFWGSVIFSPSLEENSGVTDLAVPQTSVFFVNGHALDVTVSGMPYDLDQDQSVNVHDLIEFLNYYGQKKTPETEGFLPDYTGDGSVTVLDLIDFLGNYGKKKVNYQKILPASETSLSIPQEREVEVPKQEVSVSVIDTDTSVPVELPVTMTVQAAAADEILIPVSLPEISSLNSQKEEPVSVSILELYENQIPAENRKISPSVMAVDSVFTKNDWLQETWRFRKTEMKLSILDKIHPKIVDLLWSEEDEN